MAKEEGKKSAWSKTSAAEKDAKDAMKDSTVSKQTAEEKLQAKLGIELFTDEDVLDMIDSARKRKSQSYINCALVGHDGVGKSGLAMDCRKEDEMDMDVFVIDLDGSASPIRDRFFVDDERMVILDPVVLKDPSKVRRSDDIIDYVNTYVRTIRLVGHLYENQDQYNMKALVIDGLDTLLKTCEMVMRAEDLNELGPAARVKDQWSWQNRNRKFLTVTFLAKRFGCDTYYTTHLKADKKMFMGAGGAREFKTIGYYPEWEKNIFPGTLYQRITCSRNVLPSGNIDFEATIEKAKGATELEGKVYRYAKVKHDKDVDSFEWLGMKPFFDTLRGRQMA